ncbi:MAG: histidine phosphatase family protein [Cytophagales bacterium]|nr:histidine phosphatase family protein [Cytophagales bacterium]
MKKLFIVRHAKSSWDYPHLDDYDRPLNKRGKRNAPEMGQRLAQKNVKPDALIASPAKRAAATARRIAEQISFPVSDIVKEPLLYHGSVSSMIDVIRSSDDGIETLMIFGHNPGLTDLTNRLSGSDIYNIPTCGIAEIDFDVASWQEVGNTKGNLVSFDFPKNVLKT